MDSSQQAKGGGYVNSCVVTM